TKRRGRIAATVLASSSVSSSSSINTAAPALPLSPSQQSAIPSTIQIAGIVADLTAIKEQHKALANSISRLEAAIAEQRRADLDLIEQKINNLAQNQSQLTTQLPQAHLLDLLSQLVNINQLPKLLLKLNSNVKKLAEPKAKRAKAKTRSKKKAPNKK